MNRMTIGLIAATLAVGYCAGASAQELERFQLVSKSNNGCVHVEPARLGPGGIPPIIDGVLRTSGCNRSPDGLIELGSGPPHSLVFRLKGNDFRCINVRRLDMQTVPSDIFVNKCTPGTSHWELSPADAAGFRTISFFEGFNLCLAVNRLNRHIMIDQCLGSDPRQRWKLQPVTQR